jgi:putative acyl-CoA dehydrogenase
MAKQPESVEAFFGEIDSSAGADHRLDDAVARLRKELADVTAIEHRARRIVETMALVLQGALLVRYAPAVVADAFCASRLGGDWGVAFGTLPPGIDTAAIIDRVSVR